VNPSSQTPGVTRGCDLRGAENRGRSTCYASYVDEPVMMVSGASTKHYFHQNHLYSVAAMTNSTGAVVERYRYDAYGKRTVTNAAGTPIAASTIGQQRGFTGYYLDAETGLYYARARMYSAWLGRFVERDTRAKNGRYPSSLDGYQDGMSLYSAYMVPSRLDPSGQNTMFVDMVTTTPPTMAKCNSGKSDAWWTQFSAYGDATESTIIQEINWSWDVRKCDGTPVPPPDWLGSGHFFETWPVRNDGSISMDGADQWSVSGPIECTFGTVVTTGVVRVVPKLTLDVLAGAGWDLGNQSLHNTALRPPSGILNSIWADDSGLIPGTGIPASDRQGTIERRMTVSWSCCYGGAGVQSISYSPTTATAEATW